LAVAGSEEETAWSPADREGRLCPPLERSCATTDRTETERVDCTDCLDCQGSDNTRIAMVKTGGGISETRHTPDCPQLTIMQINFEEGHKRVMEQDAWAKGVFPAMHKRLKYAAVIDELLKAPVLQLYLTPMQKAHAIVCDASREGMRLYYPGGDVEQVTPQLRRDVHDGIAAILERDWPPYIQGLISRGALQTQ
jgi:hypothetical protein